MTARRIALTMFLTSLPALAQPVLEETPILPIDIGQGARRIEVRDLNGDGLRDILLVRPGGEGTVIEQWLRNDATNRTYVSGPPLGLFENVVDALVFDFDADGDNDIVVATGAAGTAPGGVSLLSNVGGAAFIPLFSRGALQSLANITALKFQDVETPGGVRFGVAAITADAMVQLYAVVPGIGMQAVQALPHPGGVATTVAVPFQLVGGSAVLSLGAAPQRLWVWNGNAYAERAVTGIDRRVLRATSVTVDGDDVLDLATADDSGRVEVWSGSSAAAGQPADRFDLVQQLETSGNLVSALDTANVEAGKLDVLVGRLPSGPANTIGLHRIDIASGSIAPRVSLPSAASGIGVERRSPDTVFVAGAEDPLRAFVRAGTAAPGTLGFSRDGGYYTMQNLNPSITLTSTPLPQSGTLRLSTPLGDADGAALPGQSTHRVFLPRRTFTATPGRVVLDLQDPQIPGIILREPRRSTLTVFESQGDLTGLCSLECIMLGCIGSAGGKGVDPSAGIGTPSEVSVLRAFRDQVLNGSAKGREYVAGYDDFEAELYVVSFASPTFLFTLRDAKDAWMPAINSLVNSDGSAPITGAMLDHMDAVFAHFRTNGSERLRQLIERRYLELAPRQFVGQPIGAMRTHWEDVLRTEQVFGSGFEVVPPAR